MKAAIFDPGKGSAALHLRIEDVPRPQVAPGYVLLRVLACGVCRTDLHIVEGDLPVLHQPLIPGHQIVGEVIEGASASLPLGTRVGVSWMGGTDGDCFFCQHGMENLCDQPIFTGYSVDGGPWHYWVSQLAGCGCKAWRPRRTLRLRQFRDALDSSAAILLHLSIQERFDLKLVFA